MAKISKEEINLFSRYVRDVSGIFLSDSKGYLLETRLKPIFEECKASTYTQLYHKIKGDGSRRLERKLIDVISTNETFFFRDNTPFDLMRNKIIPDLIDRRRKEMSDDRPIPVRVWSAASSTGQEVYSIAITLLEMLAGRGRYEIFILGTDISGDAISQASYGKYNRFEIERGLPKAVCNKYFSRAGENWRIKDNIRSLVKFEKMNLMKPFANIGMFDLVFCRNVAIYFQNTDKTRLFKKIAKVLKPGGSLIVGGSENLTNIATDFVSNQYLKGIFYALKSDGTAGEQTIKAVMPSVVRKTKTATLSRPRRKTLYENKAKQVLKKQDLLPPAKKSARPLETGQVEASLNALAHEKSPESPPVSLTDKLGRDKEGKGESLLGSLQCKKPTESSLFGPKRIDSKGKRSLLANIANKSSPKNSEEL